MGLAAAALAVSAVGTAVGTYSSIQSANAERSAAEYQAQVAANNAKVSEYNANAATAEGNQKLAAAQEQAAQHQGMIRAAFGAGGIDMDSGSALRTQQGVAQVDQLNQATITSNAARSAWNYRNQGADFTAQSQLDQMRAGQASSAAALGGIGSMLSGAGQFADKWQQFHPSSTKPSATS